MRFVPRSMLALTVLAGWSAARAADHFEGAGWYYGELHVHTGISGDAGSADIPGTCVDDCGEHATVYSDARAIGLDFAAVTDHVNGSKSATPEGFAADVALAREAHDPDHGFLTLVAGEVWFAGAESDIGHKNLYLFGDDAVVGGVTLDELHPRGASDPASCEDIATWAAQLEAAYGPVLLIPHHPAANLPMPTDWSCHDPDHEVAVEVYSEHGDSMGDGTGYDPLWSGEASAGTVLSGIDPAGYALKLGFLGGTDKHNSRPADVCAKDTQRPGHPYGGGITIVPVPEGEPFTRASLYAAIVGHRTFASSGPRLPVALRYSTGGVVLGTVGDALGVPAEQDLEVEVTVPQELARFVVGGTLRSVDRVIPLMPLGHGAWGTEVSTGERGAWVYVTMEVDGAAWYGADGCDDGGDTREFVWSSPSWVSDVPADLDGDGVAFLDGDCADSDPATHPGADDVPGDGCDQDCDGVDAVVLGDSASPPDDTGADSVPLGDDEAPPPGSSAEGAHPPGCGCASGASAPEGLLVLLGLAGLLGRRRGAWAAMDDPRRFLAAVAPRPPR